MILKIGLSGASGKMGREISQLISGGYETNHTKFELADPVQVWIDFSRREATLRLLEKACVPVVIGTTGFTEDELDLIRSKSKELPILLSPNMSPGVQALNDWFESMPRLDAEVSMSEVHHKEKKDSPSGTAKSLAETLLKRGYKDFPIESIRAGSVIGEHTIRFISDDEEITVVHRASHRSAFARGALIAAAFLRDKAAGMYTMKDVFRRQMT